MVTMCKFKQVDGGGMIRTGQRKGPCCKCFSVALGVKNAPEVDLVLIKLLTTKSGCCQHRLGGHLVLAAHTDVSPCSIVLRHDEYNTMRSLPNLIMPILSK